ncbi:hypothetical protein ABT294_16790 [Nonomuraea sp. NPDC000554]
MEQIARRQVEGVAAAQPYRRQQQPDQRAQHERRTVGAGSTGGHR